MKAILIARVSTEEQREAGNSLPAQIERLKRYCQNRNFEILHIYSFDESAYSDDRTEFDSIINQILEQKEKIAVCCDKVDRLSRNVFDKRVSLLYERALDDRLELHFTSEGQVISSRVSAAEKFQFGISLGLAKYYSDAISDNVKRAQEEKLRKGEWVSKAPYGYLNVKNEKGDTDIIVDDYTAQIIKKIFELYATKAFSIDLLTEKLKNDYGIKWPRSYVAKVLSNPFYHGTMLVKGNTYPHKYPPLISKELFDEVQAVKRGFKKQPFQFAGQPYIYRGLMRCGDCGLAITPEKHKGYVYYHCTQYNGKHGAKWFREETITQELGNVFKSLQMPDDVLEQTISTLETLHKDKVEFHANQHDKLSKEQRSLTKMMDNLYIDKLKGRITESEYDKFYQTFRDQLDEITTSLDRLQDAEDNYYITTKLLLEVSNQAFDVFMSSEVEKKRMLIKLVLQNLTITGDKIVWDAHSPFREIIKCSDRLLWRS